MMASRKYLKDSSENKRANKYRPQAEAFDDISQSASQRVKKEYYKELRSKIMEVMESQAETRKRGNEALLRSLSEVIEEMKADHTTLKTNQEKLQKLAASAIQSISQAITAQEEKITTLNEIHTAFKNQCEKEESEYKSQASKLADELEAHWRRTLKKLIN